MLECGVVTWVITPFDVFFVLDDLAALEADVHGLVLQIVVVVGDGILNEFIAV